MPSYYEINVALNGYHLFATDPRSCQDIHAFRMALKIIREKFPESEGYKVTATYWKCTGELIDINKNEEE